MNFFKLQFEKLDLKAISDQVSSTDCGAISLFIGTTRDNLHGKSVVKLEYEAYDTMAIKQMEIICERIRSKWPDVKNIAIYHRLGEVPVKEESVIVAISSPHRRDSLEAVSYCINEVKRVVPIWKKEWYDDATYSWKANCECHWNKTDLHNNNF